MRSKACSFQAAFVLPLSNFKAQKSSSRPRPPPFYEGLQLVGASSGSRAAAGALDHMKGGAGPVGDAKGAEAWPKIPLGQQLLFERNERTKAACKKQALISIFLELFIFRFDSRTLRPRERRRVRSGLRQ